MNKFLIVLIPVLLTSACSSHYLSGGEKEYLQARNGPGLVVPKPLTSGNINHFYNLPAQTQNAVVSIVPPSD